MPVYSYKDMKAMYYLNVLSLTLCSTHRLMDHDSAVWQCHALALSASSHEEGCHRCCHAYIDCYYLTLFVSNAVMAQRAHIVYSIVYMCVSNCCSRSSERRGLYTSKFSHWRKPACCKRVSHVKPPQWCQLLLLLLLRRKDSERPVIRQLYPAVHKASLLAGVCSLVCSTLQIRDHY
jgi:hypothetical protein